MKVGVTIYALVVDWVASLEIIEVTDRSYPVLESSFMLQYAQSVNTVEISGKFCALVGALDKGL